MELDRRSKKIRRIEGNRKERVIYAQLRSGYCPKTKYNKHKIRTKDNVVCERCGRLC